MDAAAEADYGHVQLLPHRCGATALKSSGRQTIKSMTAPW